MPAMSASYKGAGHGTMKPMLSADAKEYLENLIRKQSQINIVTYIQTKTLKIQYMV